MHGCTRLLHVAGSFALLGASHVLAQSAQPAIFVSNNVGDSVTSFIVNPNGSLTPVAA